MGRELRKEIKRIMNEKKEVKNSRLTRRHFARRLTQLLVYGGLVNFSLGGTAKAATSKETAHEDCPGGLPSVDVCAPPLDYDYCPGEMPPADECPADGNREEDECNSGLAAADICDPSVKRSDQCQNGLPKDDQCPESAPDDDYCPTGHPSSDSCPPDGGIADGDQCPGGGDELDTCVPTTKSGDECGEGSYGPEDDCNAKQKDCCATAFPLAPLDDDSCPNETNVAWTGSPNGGDDWCRGSFLASDECTTGKDEDDLCESNKNEYGAFDVCPGGGADVDRCDDNSDDYCVTGVEASDECPDGMPPEDVCAGGEPSEDVCYKHLAGSDECDPSVSNSDQEGCKSNDDECSAFGLLDKCTYNRNLDVIE